MLVQVINRLLSVDFVRFCIVGTAGFVINFLLLTLLYRMVGTPLIIAQFVAAELALFNNFVLHHHWTYKDNNVQKTLPRLVAQFHLTSWAAIVGSVLMVTLGVEVLHLHYGVALVLSSGIAMFWNFAWTKFAIWRTRPAGQPTSNSTEIL